MSIAPEKLAKLFSPIGLGSLKGTALLDISDSGIERRAFTEKEAAKPCVGELWIEFDILYGHYNGPKKKYKVMTDGTVVKNAFNNKNPEYGHKIDATLVKFVKHQLSIILNGSDGTVF